MDRQFVEVVVHLERSGYWAEANGLEGCFASGGTLDELLDESISMYVARAEDSVERMLVRVSGLRLEIEPNLRASSDPPTRPGTRRTRDPHDNT